MCGIVGVMNWGGGAVGGADMSAFMQMLYADAVRGMHGTGAFAVDRDGSSYRVRAGGPPHRLVDDPAFEKFETFIQQKFVRFVVGHNRFATRGKQITDHAHPFRDKHIILVHNGTLEDFKHLPDAKKYDVDSEAICHSIAVQGVEKTIPTLKGAWALVWWDGESQTINFLRNSERPLWMAFHQNDPFIAFASEEGMLKWVLNRNGKYLFDYKELPENMLFSFSLDSPKPKVKELKGKAGKSYKDYGWEAWTKRNEAANGGKGQVEADKQNVVYLPTKPATSSTSKTSSTSSGITNNRGSLPSPKKNGSGASSTSSRGGRGYWISSDTIHDISKGQRIIIVPIEYRAIEADTGSKSGDLFQISGLCSDYPDIEFFCNVKGKSAAEACLDAPYGMSGTVKSILRSMASTAQFPHKIYMQDPAAEYVEPPVNIPSHAQAK